MANARTCTSTSCAAGGVHSCWKRCRSPTSAAAGVPAAIVVAGWTVMAFPALGGAVTHHEAAAVPAQQAPPPLPSLPPCTGLPARPLTVHCRHYLLPLLLPPCLLLPPVALSGQLHQPAAAGEGCHAACEHCYSGRRGGRAGRAASGEQVCVGGRAWARGRAAAVAHQFSDRPRRCNAGWAPLYRPA